jgi:hypothetical protein
MTTRRGIQEDHRTVETEIEKPPKTGLDHWHIEVCSIPEHKECDIGPVPERVSESPMKEKTNHSYDISAGDPRRGETDGEEERQMVRRRDRW